MTERASTRLRRSINDDKLLLMPGGFSPLAVRMAESLGFESFFLAGSQRRAHLRGAGHRAPGAEMASCPQHRGGVVDAVLVDSDTGTGIGGTCTT